MFKKLLAVALVAVMSLCLVACEKDADSENSSLSETEVTSSASDNLATVSSDTYGYSFNVPSDWTDVSADMSALVYGASYEPDGSIVMFVSPSPTDSADNMNLVVSELTDLSAYTAEAVMEMYKETLGEDTVESVECTPVTVNGYDAMYIEFITTVALEDDSSVKVKQIQYMINGTSFTYFFTFTDFSGTMSTVIDEILNSITVS